MVVNRFFSAIEDIKAIAGPKLEEMLQHPTINEKDDALIFTNWVNMEPYAEMPMVVDEQGQFWVGKRNDSANLVFEEYGSNMSRLLGCPSPEVDYTHIGEKPHVVSKFIFHSYHPPISELKERGQVILVPRLLVAYTMRMREESEVLQGRLDCDINLGQFLIDDNDTFYQLDFSRPEEGRYYLNDVKRRLNTFGLTADATNEVIIQQIDQLNQSNPLELYSEFTKKSQQSSPEQVEHLKDMFLWNANNINRLLHVLDMANGEKPNYTIVHSQN